MATEPNTDLTLSPPGPLQADLIVNPVIKRLGAVGGNTTPIIDKDLSAPPSLNNTTDVGKTYIIASAPTGLWTGRATQIAYWNGISWDFYVPEEGFRRWVADEDAEYVFNGSGVWVPDPTGAFQGGNLTLALNEAKFSDIPSAATTDIGSAAGNYGHITGTTTITALGTAQAGARRITVFDGILTLTNSAAMILITGANITTAAGDAAEWESEGSGNWRMVNYARKDGTSLGGAPGSVSSVNGQTGVVVIPQSFIVACSDETTPVITGTGKARFRAPYAFTITGVRASLTTAQASGSIFTVDINENGTSILSTKITIDNTEKTSTTAATPPVVSDASIADDSEITFDIDQIGDGTATGLKVAIIGYPT